VASIKNQGPSAAAMRIEAARRIFPRVWFNEDTTEAGRDALGFYHERKDERRDIGLGPEHDWSSHAADAFGLMAVCCEELGVMRAFYRRIEYPRVGPQVESQYLGECVACAAGNVRITKLITHSDGHLPSWQAELPQKFEKLRQLEEAIRAPTEADALSFQSSHNRVGDGSTLAKWASDRSRRAWPVMVTYAPLSVTPARSTR
jgi:hypothetical protein